MVKTSVPRKRDFFENRQDEGVGLVTEASVPHFSTHKTVFIMTGPFPGPGLKQVKVPWPYWLASEHH